MIDKAPRLGDDMRPGWLAGRGEAIAGAGRAMTMMMAVTTTMRPGRRG